jgi:NADPH:quinone reductase-like Zn-dependent oxidoreductase
MPSSIVIITSSSDKKLEQARKLGADHTINYKTTPDWEKEVMKITKDEGVDIIFETGGAKFVPPISFTPDKLPLKSLTALL